MTGFNSKREAAADKLQESKREALKLALVALEESQTDNDTMEFWDRKSKAITAIKAALEQPAQESYDQTALELCNVCGWKTLIPDDGCLNCERAQPAQEPMAHPVIAGALYDFMGWLTSRKERIVLSSADNASPAADAIRDFANMRGLSLDDAKVLDWNTASPQREWVGLTAEETSGFTQHEMTVVKYVSKVLQEKNNG